MAKSHLERLVLTNLAMHNSHLERFESHRGCPDFARNGWGECSILIIIPSGLISLDVSLHVLVTQITWDAYGCAHQPTGDSMKLPIRNHQRQHMIFIVRYNIITEKRKHISLQSELVCHTEPRCVAGISFQGFC